ncbi:Putative AC transposase [Linum grandiflorum]
MRCSAHILNLIVKDGLGVVKEGIENIRDSVLYWSATPKKLEYFQQTAKQCRFTSVIRAANPGFHHFVSQRKKAKVTSVQTELDNYLNEEILPSEECENDFSILMWWRQNGPKYPILQAITRDVLAILVTSVASECAFSSGGRLLEPHRSRLHHVNVETLMCARSWLQNDLANDGAVAVAGVLEGCFSSSIEDNLL